MITFTRYLEQNRTVVFETVQLTLVAAVCNQLESAGLPARLEKVMDGYAVTVPPEYAFQSRSLLYASPSSDEMLPVVPEEQTEE
ncbi:MAG TPA: hypothetical protein VMT46_01160 [Anaerolineaceae bacterium]|nr:hypothetical protein [Anaerolineaceae bacterium]